MSPIMHGVSTPTVVIKSSGPDLAHKNVAVSEVSDYQQPDRSSSTMVKHDSGEARAIGDFGVEAAAVSGAVMANVKNEKYQCDVCYKNCFFKMELKKHRATHNEPDHECEKCGKKFKRACSRDDHVRRMHVDEKPYKCDACNQAFIRLSDLNRHKTIHDKNNRCECTVCHNTFSNKNNLLRHWKTAHLLDKQLYKCDNCKGEFVSLEDLTRHKESHMVVYDSNECPVCQLGFRSRRNLKRHCQRKHSNDNKKKRSDEHSYKCHECGSEFKKKFLLDVHREKQHGHPMNVYYDKCAEESHFKFNFSEQMRNRPQRPQKEILFTGEESRETYQKESYLKQHQLCHVVGVYVINQSYPVMEQPSTSDACMNELQIQEEHKEISGPFDNGQDTYPAASFDDSGGFGNDHLSIQETPAKTWSGEQGNDGGSAAEQLYLVMDQPSISNMHVNKSHEQEKSRDVVTCPDSDYLQTIPFPKPSWELDHSCNDCDDSS